MKHVGAHRWWVAVAAIAVAGLVMLWAVGWFTDRGVLTTAPRSQWAAASDDVAAGAVSLSPSIAPPMPEAPEVHEAGAVEVCGVGWVSKPTEGSPDIQALVSQAGIVKARQRILTTLRADPGELARATALVIALHSSDTPDWLVRLGLAHDDHADARDQLARLAATSTDPKVYRLAYKACGGNGNTGEGACQLINAEQWARLDPENAAPWLFLLWTAVQRKDSAAQDEALHRMASGKRQTLGFFDTAGVVLDAAPEDDGAQLAAWWLVAEVIGVEAAVGVPGLTSLRNSCKGEALADANRLQTCSAIAEVLAERSDTLLDRHIGASIGIAAGWPVDRSDRLRAESFGYQQATMQTSQATEDFSCAKLRRDMNGARRHAAIGETAVLHEWIAKSGKTPDDFIRAGRAIRLLDESRKEAAAAKAASAASADR